MKLSKKHIPSEKQALLSEEGILCSWRYRLFLHKRYFGHGSSLLSEWKLQYLILGSMILDMNAGLLSLGVFALISYFLGWLCYQRIRGVSLIEVEAEISNQFNKFTQEMRVEYKKQ